VSEVFRHGRWRLEARGEIPHVSTTTDTLGRKQSTPRRLESTAEIPQSPKRLGEVGTARDELEAGGKIYHLPKTVGKDGKTYRISSKRRSAAGKRRGA
jgi:hypothetical protein